MARQDATVAAIEFALRTDEGLEFLRCWMHGNFEAIRKEWSDAPEDVFVGADPLHPETKIGMECGTSVVIEDVVNERKRQQEKLGWTPSRDDDERASGELADAAACYAFSASGMPRSLCETYWPWDGGFKPKGARNDLIRAAALLVAEIERLDRLAGSYVA